jgi:hypothetical protein
LRRLSGKVRHRQIKIGAGAPEAYLRCMTQAAKEAPKPAPTRPGAGPGKPDDRAKPARPREIGGPPGSEPTRYGDWERNGRCVDF